MEQQIEKLGEIFQKLQFIDLWAIVHKYDNQFTHSTSFNQQCEFAQQTEEYKQALLENQKKHHISQILQPIYYNFQRKQCNCGKPYDQCLFGNYFNLEVDETDNEITINLKISKQLISQI